MKRDYKKRETYIYVFFSTLGNKTLKSLENYLIAEYKTLRKTSLLRVLFLLFTLKHCNYSYKKKKKRNCSECFRLVTWKTQKRIQSIIYGERKMHYKKYV